MNLSKLALVPAIALLSLSVPGPLLHAAAPHSPRALSKPLARLAPRRLRRLNGYERRLRGIWVSSDTSQGAAAGAMDLRSSGQIIMTIDPMHKVLTLVGSWQADSRSLRIEIPRKGHATMAYQLRGSHMQVLYANGIKQRFHRYVPGNSNAKRSAL
ncbi:MAG: hypothetical protein RB191_16105 [Terriglobia bacterium]|nr:hypothetical protein [Terriglobia bacterium]